MLNFDIMQSLKQAIPFKYAGFQAGYLDTLTREFFLITKFASKHLPPYENHLSWNGLGITLILMNTLYYSILQLIFCLFSREISK